MQLEVWLVGRDRNLFGKALCGCSKGQEVIILWNISII